MAYQNNIPVATHYLQNDQPAILENFVDLNAQFSVDHDTLVAGGASGKHLKVTLPERAADPVTAAGEISVYTKDSGTQPEIFYRQESNGLVTQITSNGYPISFIKAFVTFNAVTGAVIGTAYNVTGPVGVVGTQTYTCTITFTTPMADANYTVLVTPDLKNTPVGLNAYFGPIVKAAANCVIQLQTNAVNSMTSCSAVFLRIA